MVYLVEAYRSLGSIRTDRRIRRVRAAAESRAVLLRGRLVVPSDEIEFWLFEAASRNDVTKVLAVAGITGSRISAVEELTLVAPLY